MTPVEQAMEAGFTPDQINTMLADKAQKAREAGFTDEQIHGFIRDRVLQQTEFNQTPIKAKMQQVLQAKRPTTLAEAINTGWQWSVPALAIEATKPPGSAKVPEMAIDDQTPWNLRLAANATQFVSDLPAIAAGGVVGASGGPIGAWGGGMALPMGLRKVFIDAINNGQIATKQDFSERLLSTLWETAKGYVTGAVTGAVGKAAGASTSALPKVASVPLVGTAEWAAMSEVAARLEGHAPTPESLIDNALLLGVMKAVLPATTPQGTKTGAVKDTYIKTGIRPEQLAQDAVADSKVWQDALDGRVPDRYKTQIEQEPSREIQAQRAASTSTKPVTPEQLDRAKAFYDQPFAEIPQMPNEPARPGHINYNYRQAPEEVYQTLARASEIYAEQIADARKSPRSWEQSSRDAAGVLGDLLGKSSDDVLKFAKGDVRSSSVTAELLAKRDLLLSSAEDLMRKRAALDAKGGNATPEELADFYAQAEFLSNMQAGFLGNKADVARALNALKSTQRASERIAELTRVIDEYGGPEKTQQLVKMLGAYDNPAQVAAFAKELTKATTWEKVMEAWKAGLVSGLRTNEVNFLSTLAFSTLRLPVETIAAIHSTIKGTEQGIQLAEIPARVLGMARGLHDGFKVAGEILRTGQNVTGTKTDTQRAAIEGAKGEVVRLPFRTLAASDALLKQMNRTSEGYALAVRQAMQEGKTIGQQDFYGRVVDLVQNPTADMMAAADEAALRYTFNKPLGPGGKAFQKMLREWPVLQIAFPFVTTPGNIFKETARMTPGLNLAVREWREAYAKGGIEKDRALAEVSVGSAVMAAVVMGVLNGTISGGGNPDPGQRATDLAAGWKPYAINVRGQWVDGYLRMAPIGPLIGLAADGAEFAQYMTDGERDQWARMLAFAIANNMTSQSFMSGMTSMVNVIQDPSRYGENYFESLASSLVPGALGQYAAESDPLIREIHGMRDAIRSRIPSVREGLLPKRDLFGEPIKNPERLWPGSPFSTVAISGDKVRTEAARIGFAAPKPASSVDVMPGVDLGKADKVKLTPEQKDVFASRAGQVAYQILHEAVNAPGWDTEPPIAQRRTFELAFKKGRDLATKETLEGILRGGIPEDVTKKTQQQLQPRQPVSNQIQ